MAVRSKSKHSSQKPAPGGERNEANSPSTAASQSAGDEPVVTLDCRRATERRRADRRTRNEKPGTDRRAEPRRKVQRRRQIDPTTCERDYTDDEIQFMHAIDRFKRNTGRRFPTCQDVLSVIGELGYRKREAAGPDAPAQS